MTDTLSGRQIDLLKRSFLDNSPVSTAILNLDGSVAYLNPAFLKMWGIPDPKIMRDVYNIFEDSEYRKKGLIPLIKKAFSGEVVTLPEVCYEAQKEQSYSDNYGEHSEKLVTEFRWIKPILFPIFDDSGSIEFVGIIQEDITEQKELQKKLIRNERLAITGTITSGIAHEFNNILGAVKGYIQLSRMAGFDNTAMLNKTMDVIESQMNKAESITRRLTASSGRSTRVCSLIRISNAFSEANALLHSQLQKRRIHLDFFMENDDAEIFFDPAEFQEIIFNLASNAIDAIAETGRLDGCLKIRVLDSSDFVTLVIEDNGCGMDESVREKIFDPFYTTKSSVSQSSIGGTGLGMSLVHGIISDYSGTITVESSVERQFTCFTVKLPKKSDVLTNSSKQIELFTDYTAEKARVLVIEDESDILNIINDSLTLKGFLITSVASGKTGFELMKKNTYDIALVDLYLPEMSGIDIINRIHEVSNPPEIIVISGNAAEHEKELLNKVYSVCEKPLDIDLLYHTCYYAMKKSLEKRNK